MLNFLFKPNSIDYSEAYYKAQSSYQNQPNQNFTDVKNRIGLVASTYYAHMFFERRNLLKKFRRELALHSQKINAKNYDYDVLIVMPPSSMVPKKERSLLAHQLVGLSTSAGFHYVSQAQLSTDSVLMAAKRLTNILAEKRKMTRKLIVISASFGSAFVRVALDRMSDDEKQVIKGWVNLSGHIFGSRLFHLSDKKSFFQSQRDGARSFSSEQEYFKGPLRNSGIKTVHFLGLKNNQSLNSKEIGMRDQLKAWGPNDGYVPYADYQQLEQVVVPLVDQGHFIDVSTIPMTFIRTLSAMVSTLPMDSDRIKYRQSLRSDFRVNDLNKPLVDL